MADRSFPLKIALTSHYKYVYDGQGNIVRSIDILARKEYNYLYEDGKIMQSTESVIVLDENTNMVISKAFVCAVRYYYDTEDGLTKKHIKFADGKEFTENYEKTENDSQVVKFTAGGKTVISHSKTDSFGRKVFDELQLSTGFISRQFSYHAGEVTKEHKNNDMLKSSPTTQLVSQIVLSGGRTISYKYDEEERITKVDDSVDGITEYTYDALGQLVAETKDSITTKFEYDNYGNILAKGVVDENGEISEATKSTYEYGNEKWKDLLTSYNGQAIVYDEQGNPTEYLGHNLTWEKGRQLKRFVKDDGTVIDYAYDSDGIRTSKTVDNIRHDFVLDGAKILREGWNFDETINTYRDILVPLYDNEDSVCGIEYNGTAYYFLKNLQGDVIAITDSSGEEVARYSYDAWGKVTVFDTNGVDITERTTHIANINPFRYRSYYFDLELGLYYVSSRYYDPEIGRFLNADEATYLGADSTVLSYNLYAYCENEPTNNEDRSGNWLLRVICGVVAGAVFGGVALAICTLLKLTKKQKTYISLAFTALGVLLGALLGVKIITKVAPQLIKWFRKIEKNIAFSFKGKECKVGVELFHIFKIMIHRPHTTGLHKYNPIGWHIQFEIKWLGRWIVVFRIKIDTIVKWYQSMK